MFSSQTPPLANGDGDLFVQKVFKSESAFDTAVSHYCNSRKYSMNRSTITPKRANPFLIRPYFRWACKRSGNNRTKKSQPGAIPRPGRTSFKCGCSFYISATHPLLSDNSGVDKSSVVIVNLNLEHDNGCSGNDDLDGPLNSGLRYV